MGHPLVGAFGLVILDFSKAIGHKLQRSRTGKVLYREDTLEGSLKTFVFSLFRRDILLQKPGIRLLLHLHQIWKGNNLWNLAEVSAYLFTC